MANFASWTHHGHKYIVYDYLDKQTFYFRVVIRGYIITSRIPEEQWRHNMLHEPRFRRLEEAIDWISKTMEKHGCPESERQVFIKRMREKPEYE
jgi:hypothetical protein